MSDPYDFNGRVAVVTGGATGIGAATAALFARYGAHTVLVGRKPERLEAKAAEIAAASGRRSVAIPADVRNPEQVKKMVEQAMAEFGRIDVLVNNAGGATSRGPLQHTTPEMWLKGFALNSHAAFYGSHAALPHMIAGGGGAIINVSSFAGVYGVKEVGDYSAAKSALQMFTRVAAAEWGPLGVRVNCVAAGMTATEVQLEAWARRNFDPKDGCTNVPMRRPGLPVEVAHPIVFLASDAASYITGETLSADGGPQLNGTSTSTGREDGGVATSYLND